MTSTATRTDTGGSNGAPVVVVSALDDLTADLVIAELADRDVPVVRLDPGRFPDEVTVNARPGDRQSAGTVATASRTLELAAVRSVYWRRPTPYHAPAGLTGYDAQWCVDQARYGLGGVLCSLPAHYVNHPWRNRDAEYKPAQLAAFARCGLRAPDTLITNDPERAREFAGQSGPVVYKPLWNTPYRGADGRARAVWTETVRPESLDDSLSGSAHLLQRMVDKETDVRLTAVGRRLFAVRIDGTQGLDWRVDYDALSYAPIAVPPAVRDGVGRYLDAFGLVFGAFDFGIDRNGAWWVFECNPNGQWAWVPEPFSRGVATALADELQHAGGVA